MARVGSTHGRCNFAGRDTYYKGMRAKALTWPVVVADVCCGSFVAAVASTLGLLIANWIGPRI
jgi:uncharacterized membrane protein